MGSLLWVVAVVLVVLLALGFAMNFTMGGFIHVLLILAIVAVLFRIISGRQAV